jgi:hypothetical protein
MRLRIASGHALEVSNLLVSVAGPADEAEVGARLINTANLVQPNRSMT